MVFVDNGGIESLWTFIKVILIYIPVRSAGGGLAYIFHPPIPSARHISETRIATTRIGAKYFTIAR